MIFVIQGQAINMYIRAIKESAGVNLNVLKFTKSVNVSRYFLLKYRFLPVTTCALIASDAVFCINNSYFVFLTRLPRIGCVAWQNESQRRQVRPIDIPR